MLPPYSEIICIQWNKHWRFLGKLFFTDTGAISYFLFPSSCLEHGPCKRSNTCTGRASWNSAATSLLRAAAHTEGRGKVSHWRQRGAARPRILDASVKATKHIPSWRVFPMGRECIWLETTTSRLFEYFRNSKFTSPLSTGSGKWIQYSPPGLLLGVFTSPKTNPTELTLT